MCCAIVLNAMDFLLRNAAVKSAIGALAFVPACIVFWGGVHELLVWGAR